MMGGWSQALLKLFLAGEELVPIADPKKPTPPKVTPFELYRKAMDDERYDEIRELLAKSEEGPLVGWTWDKKPEVVEEVEVVEMTKEEHEEELVQLEARMSELKAKMGK